MANKLFLVCATFALCFLLTSASIYRTVVEFDEDDESNPIGPMRPRQKCRKEFRQAEHLQACQQWIHKQLQKPRGGPGLDLDLDLDEDDFENPQGPHQHPPLLQRCCNELREEESICVCPTLKRAAKAIRSQGSHGPVQTSKIFHTAKNLPEVCNIPNVDVCPFKAKYLFPPSY